MILDRALAAGPTGVRVVGEDRALALDGLEPAGAGRLGLALGAPVVFVESLLRLDHQAAAIAFFDPGLEPAVLRGLAAELALDAIVRDGDALPPARGDDTGGPTDWWLTTSGTTGRPKLARHDLASLARTVRPPRRAAVPRWGLLYHPARFAGLQVVLQALLGGGVLLAPRRDAPLGDRLAFLEQEGVTHLSGTPTLWRSILRHETALPSLRQITLGGEIADGPLLSALAGRWPAARIVHIWASTEIGVGFSVADERPGFPAAWLDTPPPGGPAIRLAGGELWLRPPGGLPADRARHVERDAQGFARTGDQVRLEGDRVLFEGRGAASINVGGTKIAAEAIEQVALQHPGVRLCRARAKASGIAGAVVTLDVVPEANLPADLAAEVRRFCAARLPREARPAIVRLVDAIDVNAAGKVTRHG